MARKWGAIGVAVAVTAVVMQADHESPGATARGAAELRDTFTPVVSEAVGAAGDVVLIGRDELQRQGVNPTGMFDPNAGQLQPPSGPPDVPSLGGE